MGQIPIASQAGSSYRSPSSSEAVPTPNSVRPELRKGLTQTAPGVKASDLKPCAICGQGLMRNGGMFCHRVRSGRLYLGQKAARQHAGLTMMLGSAQLASVFASDDVILKPLGEEQTVLVCDDCFFFKGHLRDLWQEDPPEAEAPATKEPEQPLVSLGQGAYAHDLAGKPTDIDPHTPTQTEISASRTGHCNDPDAEVNRSSSDDFDRFGGAA